MSELNFSAGKVFVEIGFGWDPAFLGAADNTIRLNQFADTHYIGIDVDGRQVRLAKDATSRHSTDHMLSIGLNKGNLNDLSLPDGSVDELYLANVFAGTSGEQDLADLTYTAMHLKDKFDEEADPQKKKELLRSIYPRVNDPRRPLSSMLLGLEKAKKMLKPNGQLTVVETNTPTEVEVVRTLVEDLGFEIGKIVTEADRQDWLLMEDRYHMQEGYIFDQEPYIIIAHPR